MKKISVILTNRNTRDYLELAIQSIYANNQDLIESGGEVIVLDDNSNDGSKEILEELESQLKNFYWVSHDNSDRLGLMILNEAGIFFSDNELIFLGHSDMVYAKCCFKNLEKYIEKGKVICSTRIEPPIYQDESIRYQREFGKTPEEFKEKEFNEEVERLKTDKLTDGVFAPILMYKEDFCGYDKNFLPQSREDSTLFYQMAKKGIKFLQSWSSIVYHFSGKGSRKKDSLEDSEEWRKTNYKNTKNFIRLFGELPNHLDKQPNIDEKIKLTLCVATHNDENRIYSFIERMEPWFDEIIILDDSKDNTVKIIHKFIEKEKTMSKLFEENKIIFIREIKFNNDYSELRNTMQKFATKEWCLHADPDEEFSVDLLNSLRFLIKTQGNQKEVFGFARANYLNGVLVNDIPRQYWNEKTLKGIKENAENRR